MIKIHLITLDLCWPLSVIVSRSFITYLTDQLDTSNWVNTFSIFWWRACLLPPGALNCLLVTYYLLRGHLLLTFPVTLTFSSMSNSDSTFYQNAFPHYSLKSERQILIKNLHRKIATCPYYYYCPLVDLLICILCEV